MIFHVLHSAYVKKHMLGKKRNTLLKEKICEDKCFLSFKKNDILR